MLVDSGIKGAERKKAVVAAKGAKIIAKIPAKLPKGFKNKP